MTTHLAAGAYPGVGDSERLGRVRAGDAGAFGELYVQHRPAALRAAHGIVRDQQLAQDLVSEAFARVLELLSQGGGPERDLFPYLFAAMRNIATSWARDTVRWTPVGTDTVLDQYRGPGGVDGGEDAPSHQLSVRLTSAAYEGLPARWREALWYLEVERERAAQVSVRLGMSETAVRQLACRARAGLRDAYLIAYIAAGAPVPGHVHPVELAQIARGRLGRDRRHQLDPHLTACSRCRRILHEATEENEAMRPRSPLGRGHRARPLRTVADRDERGGRRRG